MTQATQSGLNCCGTRLAFGGVYLGVEIAARIAILAAGMITYLCCDPFIRSIWPTQWYEYAKPYSVDEKFPGGVTVAICLAVPIAFLVGFLIILRFRNKWTSIIIIEETIFFIFGYSLSVLFVFLISEFVKRLYGRLRPDFLARCFGTNNVTDWLISIGIPSLAGIPPIPDCSGSPFSDHDLADGRMSFPSEHSGLTWTVFTFTAFWVYGKLCLFHNTGAFRLVLPLGILLLPTAVAISRTCDYRHHPSDVFAGSLIGFCVAWLIYCFYWPFTMKPLVATSYCIYEGTSKGRAAKLREVTAARFMVDNNELFLSPEFQARRNDFFQGRVFADRRENQKLFADPAVDFIGKGVDDEGRSTENSSPR